MIISPLFCLGGFWAGLSITIMLVFLGSMDESLREFWLGSLYPEFSENNPESCPNRSHP